MNYKTIFLYLRGNDSRAGHIRSLPLPEEHFGRFPLFAVIGGSFGSFQRLPNEISSRVKKETINSLPLLNRNRKCIAISTTEQIIVRGSVGCDAMAKYGEGEGIRWHADS